MVKSPKVYIRDSGILHALLNISNIETLLCHPILDMSWEGFVIDNILRQLPEHLDVFFYRTARGAELDLLNITPKDKRIALKLKWVYHQNCHEAFMKLAKIFSPMKPLWYTLQQKNIPSEKIFLS